MIRSMKRNIAKNLMKDMGFNQVNRKMGYRNGLKRGRVTRVQVRNGMKTQPSRDRLSKFLKEHPPVWRRVLDGDLKDRAHNAFMAESRKRKIEACYR